MRYLLFGGEAYYPKGGANDLLETSESLEYLLEQIKDDWNEEGGFQSFIYIVENESIAWWHIYDSKKKIICEGSEYQGFGAGKFLK